MANVLLENVSKVYKGGVRAVKSFNLEIKDKEFVVFVGPSGCGKSTTLRMIAGLEDITSGTISIDGRVVNDVEPKDRDIAMVFQNYALYPHMSVYENMAFGLQTRHFDKDEIDRRVREAAEILDITEYLNRKPKNLSGGQRQRVALGRAIVRNPKVFLLDEPLSNLDAKLRVQMRAEISKLYRRLGTTFIYVTHDQTEAMTMGTRIVVMKDGVIQQVDTPSNLFDHPANTFVATFLGSPQMNLIEGKLIKNENDGRTIYFGDMNRPSKVELPSHKLSILPYDIEENKEVLVGIRPEDFCYYESGESPIKATIDLMEKLGNETMIYFTISGTDITASCRTSARTGFAIGDTIPLTVNAERIHLFDKTTTDSLFKAREINYLPSSYSNKGLIIGKEVYDAEKLEERKIGDLSKTKSVCFEPEKVSLVKLEDSIKMTVTVDYTLWEAEGVAVFTHDDKNNQYTFYLDKEPKEKELTVYVPLANVYAIDEEENKLSTIINHNNITVANTKVVGNDFCYSIPGVVRTRNDYAHIINLEVINNERALIEIETTNEEHMYLEVNNNPDLYIGRLVIVLKNKKGI